LPVQKGTASARVPREASGKKFVFAPNSQKLEAFGLEFGKEGDAVTLVGKFDNGVEQRIGCGDGEWKKGRAAFGAFPEQAVAASGAWTADDTFTAQLCFPETPYLITLSLVFSADRLQFDPTWNVSFGPTKPGRLVGELK
jgi:hypothetical protein